MTFRTTAKTKISIGTSAVATDQTGYEADTYTQVLGVEDAGEFGDSAEEVTFATIEDSRVRKLKGVRDAGVIELIVGRDASDPGQVKMREAVPSDEAFNIKIELNDKPNATGSNSIFYCKALVMTGTNRLGTVNDVTKQVFRLAINSEILEIPAEAGV